MNARNHFAPLGEPPRLDPIKYESEVFAIALTFGVNPDRVVQALTGNETCTPFEFVDAWVDNLDRDNANAYEDWQHAESEIRAIYAGMA